MTTRKHSSSSLPRCSSLSDADQLPLSVFVGAAHEYFTAKEYFCGPDAPSSRRCRCSASETCRHAPDPFNGGNIGTCGCCAAWIFVILAIVCLFLFGCVCVAVYYFCCQNRWWCDGAPKVEPYRIPQTGATNIVPADMPFPSNLFRGYHSSNFINYDPDGGDDTAGSGIAANGTAPASGRAARSRGASSRLRHMRPRVASEGDGTVPVAPPARRPSGQDCVTPTVGDSRGAGQPPSSARATSGRPSAASGAASPLPTSELAADVTVEVDASSQRRQPRAAAQSDASSSPPCGVMDEATPSTMRLTRRREAPVMREEHATTTEVDCPEQTRLSYSQRGTGA